ncbi:MAG TPA: acetyl-CoA carboxylase carboxyl transferase subunit alpha [Alphaproteobacteria bacterium]|nr:acetyl-CoA carboxylase carboxyl transferase subunit alpha [Alphaproteobacteria bacterium]
MAQESSDVVLDFEEEIVSVEEKIAHLEQISKDEDVDTQKEIKRLKTKLNRLISEAYQNLSPWQKTEIARHPDRPHTIDFINALIEDFVPLSGDRRFADDEAMIGGIGKFEGISVVVMGQEKGHDLDTRMKHNFGMARPEGYRKAQRLMDLASRLNMPILTFVDTAGAYPGVDAEERGQAEAIASSIEKCFQVKVPIISTVIGEGGSGGAIAIATANVVMMLSNAIYSVISPEGCASILWRSADKVVDATEALKLTAQDLKKLKVIDEIIEEPMGGAHRHKKAVFDNLRAALRKHLTELLKLTPAELKKQRTEKFLDMTRHLKPATASTTTAKKKKTSD